MRRWTSEMQKRRSVCFRERRRHWSIIITEPVCGCSYWGCKTESVNSVHGHLNARVETRKDEPLLFKGLPSDSSRSSSASCSRTSWGRADTSTPRSAIMARNRGEERRRTVYRQQKCPWPPHSQKQMVLDSRPSSIISAMPREKSQPIGRVTWPALGMRSPCSEAAAVLLPLVWRERIFIECSIFNSNASVVKVMFFSPKYKILSLFTHLYVFLNPCPLSWNTKGEVLKKLQAAIFHATY